MGTVRLISEPNSTSLTTVARVKDELGISESTYDTLLGRLVEESSSMIYRAIGRELYRAQWVETLMGNGRTEMLLSRFPVMSLEAVSYLDSAQTLADFSISGRDKGSIYVASGFSTSNKPTEWEITYTAGFFLPGDTQTLSTISATASDDSYNDSATSFLPLVRAGDPFRASSFTDASNNGLKTVKDGSTPTTAKIEIEGALVDEVDGSARTLDFEHPDIAGFSRVATQLVGDLYRRRAADKSLKSLTVGDVRFEWDLEIVQDVRRRLAVYSDPV